MSYVQQISVSSTGYDVSAFDVAGFARALSSAQRNSAPRESNLPPQNTPTPMREEARTASPSSTSRQAEQLAHAESLNTMREAFVSVGGVHQGHHPGSDASSAAGREAMPTLLSARYISPAEQSPYRSLDSAAAMLIAHASMPVGTIGNLIGQQTLNANGTEFWQFYQIISMGYTQIGRRENFYTDMIRWKRRANPKLVQPVIDEDDGELDMVRDILDTHRDAYQDDAA